MRISSQVIEERRRVVFLILSGFFLGSMVMLNILGITKFIQLGPLTLTIGVLPYPLTFLCTDLISELYGKKRASLVVWVGLLLNLFVLMIMYIGDQMPGVKPELQPPWQVLELSQAVTLPNGEVAREQVELFHILYTNTAGLVFGSMLAYLAAQFCDVQLFHFFKKLTKGRHLWLRNNGSTLVSQLVDTVTVISIAFMAPLSSGEMSISAVLGIMGSSYLFKMVVALVDTVPAYALVRFFSGYLRIDPSKEHQF